MNIERIDGLPFGRAYKIFNEKEEHFLPSVTTILKTNDQSWLDELRETLGELKFQEVTDRGARRGSVLHLYLELFLIQFDKTPDPEKCLLFAQKEISNVPELEGWEEKYPKEWKEGRNLFYNFYNINFWEKIKKVLYNELFMYTFFKGGWAGATDFIYQNYENEIIVEDFKSSSYIKDQSKIENYYLQISAYMFKYADMFKVMPKRGIIIISNLENEKLQEFVVEDHELKNHMKKFVYLLEEFYKTEEWIKFIEEKKQNII